MIFSWFGSRTWEATCLYPWFQFRSAVTLEGKSPLFPTHSLEEITGERLAWGSKELNDYRLLKLLGKEQENGSDKRCILSYSPAIDEDQYSLQYAWRISRKIAKLFSNKLDTRKWLKSVGLPTLDAIAVDSKSVWPTVKGYAVLQSLEGSCGIATYIGSLKDLKLLFNNLPWKKAIISSFYNGVIINGHVAIFPDGKIEVPWPSIQLIYYVRSNGIIRPIYAGNDYQAYDNHVNGALKNRIQNLFYRLGKAASNLGYRGILGTDILCDLSTNDIKFLEVNARLQGSSGLLTCLEDSRGLTPTIVRIFNALIGGDSTNNRVRTNSGFYQNHRFVSQAILRNGTSELIGFKMDGIILDCPDSSLNTHFLANVGRFLTSKSICYENRSEIFSKYNNRHYSNTLSANTRSFDILG